MLRRTLSSAWLFVVVCSLILPFAPPASAQAGLPSFQVQYLGPGTPVALNNSGTVVGSLVNGNNYTPLVSVGGAAWTNLPLPSGGVSVFPTDINDAGIIVGVSYDANWNPTAVRWTPQGSGYAVEVLPRLPGDASSYATGVNNLGQIVGAKGALGYVPTGSGWLYSDQAGIVDLYAQYGWVAAPTQLNDNGVLIGSTEMLDLNSGALTVLPPGPSNYNPIVGRYINNGGQIAGDASLRSTSLSILSAYRYDPGSGWLFIAGSSKYTMATSLNAGGDVGYGELGAGLYLAGQGAYALYSLLDPAATATGWTVTGSGPKINDARQVAVVGRNSTTGQSGGVLLTPAGTMQAPTAPANLQGSPHYGTYMQPWNSIDLTWENTSSLTNGYELQRREAGTQAWTPLTLAVPPSVSRTSHSDTTVGVNITYDYRVRAVGVAGPGPWSNIATVTSPVTPLDQTPPSVSITAPANGASVSGTVVVTAQATDNVAVTYLEISYWNQYQGQEVILGSTNGPGPLSVNWNTAGLTTAAYQVWAMANDAMGNWTQAEITVNVTAGASRVLRISNIVMSGSARGSTASITGTVYVKDAAGKAVSGARVDVRWSLPGGTSRTASATTGSSGVAKFSTSGPRGAYTLTVTNASKSGYTYDAAGSVTSASITR